MKKNVGSIDKVIRIVLAAVMIVLVAMHAVSGVPAILFGILAAVLLLTSLVGICPLYLPFGISTVKK